MVLTSPYFQEGLFESHTFNFDILTDTLGQYLGVPFISKEFLGVIDYICPIPLYYPLVRTEASNYFVEKQFRCLSTELSCQSL